MSVLVGLDERAQRQRLALQREGQRADPTHLPKLPRRCRHIERRAALDRRQHPRRFGRPDRSGSTTAPRNVARFSCRHRRLRRLAHELVLLRVPRGDLVVVRDAGARRAAVSQTATQPARPARLAGSPAIVRSPFQLRQRRDVPSAAERLDQQHARAEPPRQDVGGRPLARERRILRGGHLEIARDAAAIPVVGQRHRPIRRRHRGRCWISASSRRTRSAARLSSTSCSAVRTGPW